MKIKKLTLSAAALAMVLGIGNSALAQGMDEHHAQQPQAQQPQTQQPQAQQPQTQQPQAQQPQAQQPQTQQPQAQQPPAQQPQAQQPPAQQPQAQQPPAQQPPVQISCPDIFREEQTLLAQTGVYPTSVSERARACEGSGEVNPYPAPYFYDADGFLYVYDPVADRYTSHDPATGLLYIYDLVTHSFYTYDPATGTYS